MKKNRGLAQGEALRFMRAAESQNYALRHPATEATKTPTTRDAVGALDETLKISRQLPSGGPLGGQSVRKPRAGMKGRYRVRLAGGPHFPLVKLGERRYTPR